MYHDQLYFKIILYTFIENVFLSNVFNIDIITVDIFSSVICLIFIIFSWIIFLQIIGCYCRFCTYTCIYNDTRARLLFVEQSPIGRLDISKFPEQYCILHWLIRLRIRKK